MSYWEIAIQNCDPELRSGEFRKSVVVESGDTRIRTRIEYLGTVGEFWRDLAVAAVFGRQLHSC